MKSRIPTIQRRNGGTHRQRSLANWDGRSRKSVQFAALDDNLPTSDPKRIADLGLWMEQCRRLGDNKDESTDISLQDTPPSDDDLSQNDKDIKTVRVEPEADGSTISINLENPDFICVTIRKTSKVSVTDENDSLKLRIPFEETVAQNVAENFLKIQLPREDSSKSSEESFKQFLDSWPSEETDELSETEFDLDVLRSRSSDLANSVESLGAASNVCKVLRAKGWKKGEPKVNLPFRPGGIGLQKLPRRSAAGGCQEERGSFNFPSKRHKQPPTGHSGRASCEPQRFRHFFDFDLEDNLQTESFLEAQYQEPIKNLSGGTCFNSPRPPRYSPPLRYSPPHSYSPSFLDPPPHCNPPLLCNPPPLKPTCHSTPSYNTFKIFQRSPYRPPKRFQTRTKIPLVDKLSTTCQIDPKESVHSDFSEVELSNLSYCIAPKKEKDTKIQTLCYRSEVRQEVRPGIRQEVRPEVRRKSNMPSGHSKRGNITFDKRLDKECRGSDVCCKKDCEDREKKNLKEYGYHGRKCCEGKHVSVKKVLCKSPDFYRQVFGPTLDETILTGMEVISKKLNLKNPLGCDCEDNSCPFFCPCPVPEPKSCISSPDYSESSSDSSAGSISNRFGSTNYSRTVSSEGICRFEVIEPPCEKSEYDMVTKMVKKKDSKESLKVTTLKLESKRGKDPCKPKFDKEVFENFFQKADEDISEYKLLPKPVEEHIKKSSSALLEKRPPTAVIDVEEQDVKSVGPCNVPYETRFAITRILKYDEFTTYEIYKSTRAKPRCLPEFQEGIFVLKNRTVL